MIIQHPISSEKFIRLIETENKVVFVVDPKAGKREIKQEIEELLGAKVERINTVTMPTGKKRAFVRFAAETPAIDIATKLGLM